MIYILYVGHIFKYTMYRSVEPKNREDLRLAFNTSLEKRGLYIKLYTESLRNSQIQNHLDFFSQLLYIGNF